MKISEARRLRLSLVTLTFVAAIVCAAVALARSGGGTVELPLPTGEGHKFGPAGIGDLAVAPDGDLLAAVSDLSTYGNFAVARLHRGGALDTTFGDGGFTERLRVPHSGHSEAQAEGIVATGSGGAVVAGYLRQAGGSFAPLLARYRADGALDRGFGNGGIVSSSPPPAPGGAVLHDLALLPGGGVVAVGAVDEQHGGRPAALVSAYRGDGSRDRTFGKDGSVRLAGQRGSASYTGLLAVAVTASGKVLTAGYRGSDLVLMRLDQNGTLDRGFGDGDGIAAVDIDATACCAEAASIALQRDGRIVVGGNGGTLANYHEVLTRFRADGSRDQSFGRHGVVDISTRRLRTLRAVAVRRNGWIVAAGEGVSSGPGGPFFTVLGFRPDGGVDTGFATNGVSQFTGGQISAARAAVSSGGRVVIGGGVRREAAGEYRYSLLLRMFG